MLLLARNSHTTLALCRFTLGLLLLVVAVGAQTPNDRFIIRVADQPSDLDNAAVGDARASDNFDDLFLNAAAPATGLGGTARGAAQTPLQAPDVVVVGLNLLQRNNLVAAAGNALVPVPQQRNRLHLNSGLRRR